MTNTQKVLLAFSCVFFAATIYSLFYFEVYLIVLFFLLHSLCLIFFTYLTYAQINRDVLTFETYHQDIGLEMAGKDTQINELKTSLSEITAELSKEKGTSEHLKDENEKIRTELEKAREEKASFEEKLKDTQSPVDAAITGLLPPLAEDNEGRETVNIIAIAKQASDELTESARAVGLHITVSTQGDTLLVRADPNRLVTLFRNIIDNSIKYMKRQGSLVITISTIGDDIFIVLKDTGEGLNEDETRHIFELNYQGSNRISGNGLGLAQAKAIVESYGGTIYAKSTEGKGMGIYIQLPA